MAYLFLHGPEDHRRPPNALKRQSQGQTPQIEMANGFVVTIFAELQKIWRRQGTLRRTFGGMPTSNKERESWKRLTRYLATLPPPERN